MADRSVEPWLRGALPGVPLPAMPIFFVFEQVREDLERFGTGLTAEQTWLSVEGNAPLGFHLRHMAGSVDRLLTYLEGGDLSEEQFSYLQSESVAGDDFNALYTQLCTVLDAAKARLLRLDLSDARRPCFVGRRRLQVTTWGLLVHLAEHTQRHLGQAITTAKYVASVSKPDEPNR